MSKPYKMSEYCEDYVCEILGINEADDIPEDIRDHVTECQHDNDVIDGGKLSRGQVEHYINTMGQDPKGKETPAQRSVRKAKLEKELAEIGNEDTEKEKAANAARSKLKHDEGIDDPGKGGATVTTTKKDSSKTEKKPSKNTK